MLNGQLQESGILTKVRAMGARLMSCQDYERIVNLESVTEMILFLKNEPGYSDIFANMDEAKIHRGEIEHVLLDSLYMEYAKIYRFAMPKQRKMLSLIFFRYEVNILKSCIQNVHHDENFIELSIFYSFFQKHSSLNLEKLMIAETMNDILLLLKGTKYYNVLAGVQNQTDSSLFDYEMQLDIFYFSQIWKTKDNLLKGDELEAFKTIVGHKMDLLNILWIYRFKTYYKTDNSKIYASTIPIHYKLKKKQFVDMVEAATVEEMMALLKETYYAKLFQRNENCSLEIKCHHMIYEIYRKERRKNNNSISSIFTFLYLKEQEIDKLTMVLECIRYQLKPEESLSIIFN